MFQPQTQTSHFFIKFESRVTSSNAKSCDGASLEVSSQIISDNSMCFVIIKKGEIVGPKAINSSFDDNKTYVVMFLTISFNQVSD